MKVGLLIIGSEVLEGKIIEANTRQLAHFLKTHHHQLDQTLIIRDQLAAIHRGFEQLLSSCDVIITSGGLGPTKDDLTKEALASFLGRKINYSTEAHQVALTNYQKYKRDFPGKEHGYCYLPDGFIPLNNSTGFAPTFFTEHLGKYIFCAPGVPKEFKSLLDDHFLKFIGDKFPNNFLMENINIRTKKVPEEKIFNEVDKALWENLAALGEVCSLPTILGVDIGIKISAQNADELQDKKNSVLKILKASPVNQHVWQIGNASLEELIVSVANTKNITFGFAESCTGGLCSHRITNIAGSSKCFLGSVISYDEVVKKDLLNVSENTLKTETAVSLKTAEEMAQGLKEKLPIDIAIAITGYAGPTGGGVDKPVGTVCLGLKSSNKLISEQMHFFGDREQLKMRFSQYALFALLDELENFA
jgi:nicotinamide-nucleotide amidase